MATTAATHDHGHARPPSPPESDISRRGYASGVGSAVGGGVRFSGGGGNREQATGNRQQATGNTGLNRCPVATLPALPVAGVREGTGNRQQATGNRQQATGNRQSATGKTGL